MKNGRSDEERLRLFVSRVDEAVARRAVTERTITAQWSIRAEAGGETQFTSDIGDEEDLRSLLLTVRSFFAEREDVYAPRIFNILDRRLKDDELRNSIREIRQAWKLALRGQAQLIVNDRTLTAENCFDMRVNGDLFHLDRELAQNYQALPEFMRSLVDQQMVSLVIASLRIVWPARNIAEHALDNKLLAETPTQPK